MTNGGAPIYSFVSKSQQGYSQRVKNKIGKQLNKKLLAMVVAETPMVGVEDYFEVVLDAMDLAPTLGLSFGGDEKRLLNFFSDIEENWDREEGVSVSNSKGKRELKNLECSINFIRCSLNSKTKNNILFDDVSKIEKNYQLLWKYINGNYNPNNIRIKS
jgi:hypothetical protein